MKEETIAIIACSAKKAGDTLCTLKAKELYQGELFKKSRRLVELRGQRWFILSAYYGLVSPEQEISTYNLTVEEMSNDRRQDWGLEAADTLHRQIEGLGLAPQNVTLDLYMGALYSRYIFERLQLRGYRLSYPLSGLGGIGNQLHKLKILIDSLEGPPAPKAEQGELL